MSYWRKAWACVINRTALNGIGCMDKHRTLRRLQLAHLLFGMMFWYGIEQLFLDKYLGSSSARGIVTIVFTLSVLIFDVPCGILADRFGRKTALLVGCAAQTIGLIVLGTSSSIEQYLLGCVLFGLFISLMNGAAQALLYDHLQLNSLSNTYAKQQGTVYAMFLIGAGIANLASGFIAHHFGLRMPYFLSLIPSILSFIILLPIFEPPLTKAATKWYLQFRTAGREILSHPRIMLFGLQFVVSEVILLTIGEFGQVYLLHFDVSTIALGLLWSLVALFAAFGRLFAHHMHKWPRTTIIVYCVVLGIFAVLHSWLGIIAYLVLYGYNEALSNVSETEIQDETSSDIRATLFSTVSFFANLIAVPAILAFTRLYVDHSIFRADASIIIVAIPVLLVTVVLSRWAPKVLTQHSEA
jgi:MFS family permease